MSLTSNYSIHMVSSASNYSILLVCLYLSKSKPNCRHFAILNFNEGFSSFQAAVYEEKSPNLVIYADLSMIYGDLSKIYDDLCM